MHRIKSVLLGQAVILGLSLTACVPLASANAETRFFVEGSEIKGSEEVELEGSLETIQLNSTIAGVKVMSVCSENKFSSAKIKAGGAASSKVEFSHCKVYDIKEGILTSLTGCTIAEPTSFAVKEQLIAGPGGVVELEVRPSSGTTFINIEVSGASCILKGKFELSGFIDATLPEGEIESTSHVLNVGSTGSGVKLGTEKGSVGSPSSSKSSQRVRVRGASSFRG
jgi:hypothetical protein